MVDEVENEGNDFADLGEGLQEFGVRVAFETQATERRAEVNRLIRELNRPGEHQKVFQFAGSAVVITRDKSSVLRSAGGKRQIIRSFPRKANVGLLSGPIEMVSSWWAHDGRRAAGDRQVQKPVPTWVFQMITDTYGEGLSPLSGIADFPVLGARKRLLSGRTGYDEKTNLYVDCEPVPMDGIPFKSGREAFSWIMSEWLGEFPFATPQDAARSLAIPLTILNRRTRIHGGAPVPFITAPTPETGKTMLARVLVEAVTGSPLPVSAWDHDNDQERRKLILALALENPAAVLFDNIQNGWHISDATLDKYVTSDEFKDRLLGKNESATAPATCLPIFTGNNIGPGSADLASRAYEVRMLAPAGRRRYSRKDLLSWTHDNRTKIFHALYTIATDFQPSRQEAWIPDSRFPSWAEYVGGPIAYAAQDKALWAAWDSSRVGSQNEELEQLCMDMASRPSINDIGYTSAQMSDMFSDQIKELIGPAKAHGLPNKIPNKSVYAMLLKYRDHPAGSWRFKAYQGDHHSRSDRKIWLFKAIPM